MRFAIKQPPRRLSSAVPRNSAEPFAAAQEVDTYGAESAATRGQQSWLGCAKLRLGGFEAARTMPRLGEQARETHPQHSDQREHGRGTRRQTRSRLSRVVYRCKGRRTKPSRRADSGRTFGWMAAWIRLLGEAPQLNSAAFPLPAVSPRTEGTQRTWRAVR